MVGSLQNQMIYLSLEFLTIGLGILSNNYLNNPLGSVPGGALVASA